MIKLFQIITLSLMLFGCAHTQKEKYDLRAEHCKALMVKNGMPYCNNMAEFEGWTVFETGYELGERSGFFAGCMEYEFD